MHDFCAWEYFWLSLGMRYLGKMETSFLPSWETLLFAIETDIPTRWHSDHNEWEFLLSPHSSQHLLSLFFWSIFSLVWGEILLSLWFVSLIQNDHKYFSYAYCPLLYSWKCLFLSSHFFHEVVDFLVDEFFECFIEFWMFVLYLMLYMNIFSQLAECLFNLPELFCHAKPFEFCIVLCFVLGFVTFASEMRSLKILLKSRL